MTDNSTSGSQNRAWGVRYSYPMSKSNLAKGILNDAYLEDSAKCWSQSGQTPLWLCHVSNNYLSLLTEPMMPRNLMWYLNGSMLRAYEIPMDSSSSGADEGIHMHSKETMSIYIIEGDEITEIKTQINSNVVQAVTEELGNKLVNDKNFVKRVTADVEASLVKGIADNKLVTKKEAKVTLGVSAKFLNQYERNGALRIIEDGKVKKYFVVEIINILQNANDGNCFGGNDL